MRIPHFIVPGTTIGSGGPGSIPHTPPPCNASTADDANYSPKQLTTLLSLSL